MLLRRKEAARERLCANRRVRAPVLRIEEPIQHQSIGGGMTTIMISRFTHRIFRLIFARARRLAVAVAAAGGLVLAIAGPAAASATVNPIAVNTANWSASAGYGSTAPGWYTDSFGLVHLQGAAKQISLKPPFQIVLGSLPPAARPTRDVFTIVHTFAGTYADLEIESNGTIAVIGPPSPDVEDLSFVSLEGITYPTGEQATREPARGQHRQLVPDHPVRLIRGCSVRLHRRLEHRPPRGRGAADQPKRRERQRPRQRAGG